MIAMAALALSATSAFAQYSAGDFTIQPKVGLNCSSTTADGAEFKAGFVGGVEAEYHVNNWFGLSVGALYSQEGAKQKNSDLKAKADYINIPVLANFYVAKGLALKAGVQPGLKVSAKYDYQGISATDKKTALPDIKSVNFSIPVGISYEYANVCLDARYNVGVSGMFDTSDSAKGQVFQLTLGYKFKL